MDIAGGEHNHLIDVISHILLFFGIAGVIVPLLQRLHVSPVLSYLVCGILIGPFGLAMLSDSMPWLSYAAIEDPETVNMLGEFGIIALMFMIGLELSFGRLKELKRYIFGIGSLQIILTATAIFGVAYLFGNGAQASILIGASLALSSTAIVMKLLEEHRISNQSIGILCFSVLLMQDLAVVPILVMASSFTGSAETNILWEITESLLIGGLTVIVIYWLGKRVITPLFQSVSFSNSPEWLAAFVVFIVILCSAFTHAAGLSLALGAFMAGLLISETEFKHEVEVIISPLKSLLLGMFFLSIGMMINIAEILNQPLLLFISVLGIYVLKAGIILPLCLAFKIPGKQSAEAAVYLSQPGEFALLILGVAMSSQLIPAEDVQFFLLVTVLAMMVTPVLFKFAPTAGRYGHKFFSKNETPVSPHSFAGQKNVLIAGFGQVGRHLGETLQDEKIPYIAFDHDGARVQRLKKQGFPVIYGDARKKELWRHLVNERVEAVVLTIDDPHAVQTILKSLQASFPLLPVIVRSKSDEDSKELYDKGATNVVSEAHETGVRIAELLMGHIKKEDPPETSKG